MKKHILFYARILATIAIFFAIFKFIPYNQLIDIYSESNKLYLFLTFFIFYFAVSLCILRWKYLLSSLGVKVSLKEAVCSYYSGLFLNLFFPSYIAGDIFRGYSISLRHGHLKKVASSVLMDRVCGIAALTILAMVSFLFGKDILKDKIVVISLISLFFFTGCLFLVIFSKTFFLFLMKVFKEDSSFKKKLISFHDQLYFFKKNPKIFAKALVVSFLTQIMLAFGFYVASLAFNVDIAIVYFLILVPIITAVASTPLTIAGAGTREAAAVYFFVLVGINKSVGLGISLLNLVFIVSTGIVGGIIYVGIYHRRLQPDL